MGDKSVSQGGGEPPQAVLIDMGTRSKRTPAACIEQLSNYDESLNVLVVSFSGRPEEWLRLMRTQLSDRPANVGFVMSGTSVRSSQTQYGPVSIREGISLRTISSVTDLVGLSISIIEYLSEWRDSDQRSVVCFDSVTTLLQSTEDDRSLRFLETLTEQLHGIETTGYFAYTPEVHDEATLSTLHRQFDDVRHDVAT